MERRTFILAGLAGLAFSQASTSVAAEAWVQSVNNYFNSVKTAYAPFTQVDPSGKTASGKFYLQKPGKMRFEYDQKDFPLTVSDGTSIAVFDNKSNKGPQTYPQGITPVSLISKSGVDLTRSKFVTKIAKQGDEAQITMADPNNKKYGTLTIRFRISNPTILGWQAIDQSGGRTTVNLKDFHTDVAMNPNLFNIVKIKNSR